MIIEEKNIKKGEDFSDRISIDIIYTNILDNDKKSYPRTNKIKKK